MPFKPQTKRFALVPVEPGNEQDTDVEAHQDEDGDIQLGFAHYGGEWVFLTDSSPVIVALGFPTEGEEA